MATQQIIYTEFKKRNKTQPHDEDQKIEEEKGENEINRSGSKESDRFSYAYKRTKGSGFVHL